MASEGTIEGFICRTAVAGNRKKEDPRCRPWYVSTGEHGDDCPNETQQPLSEDQQEQRATIPSIMVYVLLAFTLLLATAIPICVSSMKTTTPNSSVITGYIDGVRENNDGTYRIVGWTCRLRSTSSIFVDVYVGGKVWKERVTADEPSEPAVATACHVADGRNFRYSIVVTANDMAELHGQSIVVRGVANGGLSAELSGSGDFSFPALPETAIAGHVDAVVKQSNAVLVRGWACQTGDATSILVHVYAGGPAGQGSYVGAAIANVEAEKAVAAACGGDSRNHRFVARLDNASQWAGQLVYVHGISSRGTPNLVLNGSGRLSFPSFPTNLSELDYANAETRDIIIPPGASVTIDSNVDVGLIWVQGTLQCPSNSNNIEIKTEGIVVSGSSAEFLCGSSSTDRSAVNLSIVLKGNRDAGTIYPGQPKWGPKAVVITAGGSIKLHGASGKEGFTYLQETAQPGSTSIRVEQNVSWMVGDTVVVASTDFSPHETEERTIQSVSGQTVRLDRALSHRHWGETENFQNGKGQSWTLDERAAVFVINRNIRIGSEEDTWTNGVSPTGGHFIVREGGKAFVDNVEFYRMGQAGRMGRYPFHWHRLGSVNGQYVRPSLARCFLDSSLTSEHYQIQNSSVHHSFQRCIVIHQSRYAKVIRNTCYDHLGHGYFLEDGNEVKNQLIGNLGSLSKKPATINALLASDITGNNLRFAPTSTFWISHPDNLVRDNVAAGSEGSGFWMAFVQQTENGVSPPATPISANTWVFRNNKAHSCLVGITHDGAPTGSLTGNPNNSADKAVANAHYHPAAVPEFDGLVAFKCSESGLYFRGTRAIYRNAVLADNKRSIFMAYDQEVVVSGRKLSRLLSHTEKSFWSKDSLIVGISQNLPASSAGPYFGALVYDGPLWLERVHFTRFSAANSMAINKIGAAQLWTNQFRDLTFADTSNRINSFSQATGWSDEMCSSVLDADGSLTGNPGQLVLPDHAWNMDTERCHTPSGSDIFTSIVCDYEVSYLWLEGNQLDFTSIRRDAVTGHTLASIPPSKTYRNKFSLIQDASRNDYVVSGLASNGGKRYGMVYFASREGISSPLVRWEGFGSCSMSHAGRVIAKSSSLSALRQQPGEGYIVQGGDLVVKFRTDTVESKRREDTYRGRGYYVLQC